MRKYGGLAQMGQGVVIWTLLGRNLSLAGAGDIVCRWSTGVMEEQWGGQEFLGGVEWEGRMFLRDHRNCRKKVKVPQV